jgi:hypothetical protein
MAATTIAGRSRGAHDRQRQRQIVAHDRWARRVEVTRKETQERTVDAADPGIVDPAKRLARLRENEQAERARSLRLETLRRRTRPIRLILITSTLFYVGLIALYSISVVRDRIL